MSTGWFGRFVLSTIVNQNKEAWLQESKLAKMLCTGRREFDTNRWKFLPKVKHFIFRLCKNCELMMCILIVNHQFNQMHPRCSWECMLPGRCSPGKRCHTFWNRNIMLLPILLGKVNCVPKTTLCELYGVKFWEEWRETHGAVMHFPKDEHVLHFWCSFLVVHYIA